MLQVLSDCDQRLEQIPQHGQVSFHLVALTPTLDETGFFVESSVDHMSNIGHPPENLGTARLVREIDRKHGCFLKARRDTPRNSDHFPIRQLGKMLHRRKANQARRPGDEDFSFWHAKNLACIRSARATTVRTLTALSLG